MGGTSTSGDGVRAPASVSGPLACRRAGVLMHVTSLPNPGGPGDLGPSAYAFVDFLDRAGCTVWQTLPVVPTHTEDRSPYNATSAMAGNPELVSLELLAEQRLLDASELQRVREGKISRRAARVWAARRFLDRRLDPGPRRDAEARHGVPFDQWCADNEYWLEDYVRFAALREMLADRTWLAWPAGLRDRDPRVMAEALGPLTDQLGVLRVEQWFFASQWAALREYAASRGVLLFGDLPIFVSHDSADVWAKRELFRLDEAGEPTTVTGVPPDYFSADGQMWNNPHYDWDAMAADDYEWWRQRVVRQRTLFDLVRIDHFRGFEAAWHVPAGAETAVEGHWEKSPGSQVLAALLEVSGPGTLVAEDLGVITPEVDALRAEFSLPGMKVLQFAFDEDPDNLHLPAQHEELCVAYTGTHDNDTTMGWWQSLDEATRLVVRKEIRRAANRGHQVPAAETEMPWVLVSLAFSSPARLAVVPAQDLLGLGSASRMNTPGTAEGNWSWQATPGVFDDALATRVRAMVDRAGRLVLAESP